MRYHDLIGEETTILFIHGLGCVSSFDYPQVASMSPLCQHRRILIDLLGSGFSDKPKHFGYTINDHANYLLEFIEYLDLSRFIIYGHSMGGTIAILLAALCTKRISGLIISEANLDSGGGFFSKKIAAYMESDYVTIGHSELIQENRNDLNENWAIGLNQSLPEAVYRESKSLVKGQTPSWRELFYSLKISKTFIFGENSLPAPDLQELIKQNIHIEIVKNAGHSMAWENSEGLSIAVKNGINLIKET
jgi:pimeloyl-ACP methyl ester carboxylesterase